MNLQARLRDIIISQTPERGRFRVLAENSSLTEANWKNFFYERQRPNPEMLEWTCKKWPQYTMWLMTGITYPEIGQIHPSLDRLKNTPKEKPWTTKFILSKIALEEYCKQKGIDAERIATGSVPEGLISTLQEAKKMSIQEIELFLRDSASNWERIAEPEPYHDDDYVSTPPTKFPAS